MIQALLVAVVTANASAVEKLRATYRWPSGIEAIGGDPSLEEVCGVSHLGYEYAHSLQPEAAPLLELWDALELTTKCGMVRPPARAPSVAPSFPTSGSALYVDFAKGSDSAAGSEAQPLKSIARALERVAESRAKAPMVVLRARTHFLSATLEVSAAHGALTIQNYPQEEVWISGGTVIEPQWQSGAGAMAPHVGRGADSRSLYRATVRDVGSIMGLNRYVAQNPIASALHSKWVRARAPNKDPNDGTQFLQHFDGGEWLKPSDWGPALPASKRSESMYVETPSAPFGRAGSHYTYGVAAGKTFDAKACSRYTPPGGFWCSSNSSGGGSGWERMVPGAPLFPTGVKVNVSAVFGAVGVADPATWYNKSGAVIETWTNGWSTTFFTVGSIESSEEGAGAGAGEGEGAGAGEGAARGRNATFVFSGGGQQTGRGFHVDPPDPTPWKRPMEQGQWKVENAIELLDAAEEWFFDGATSTLYVVANASDATPLDRLAFVVPRLATLLEVRGGATRGAANATAIATAIAKGVTIRGVGFRDTRYTYLDEWGIPSGGDWALHRGGALFVEGAENVTVEQCAFTLLDGNALFLSGYVRNAALLNNTFAFIGDNAMAAWGYTSAGSAPTTVELPPGIGYDGTGGQQPRGTKVFGNLVREIGLNERQSSAWSEAKACESHVKGNIFFNMPRAAINKNDGFGGGTLIEQNLLVNTCRESGDHGPFNSWDRQPFLTAVRDGKTPSFVPAYNVIRSNFIVSNYGAGFGVDNDDTSSYYNITSNFFYLGGGVKCDYDGHEKRFSENLMLGTTAGCWHTCSYKKGYPDYCHDNTFVQANVSRTAHGDPVPPFAIIWFCDAKNVSRILPDYDNEVQMGEYIFNNTVLNSEARATVTCGYSGPANETTVPLSAFTDVGLMRGTTVGNAPSNAAVLQMARDLLHF